MQWVLKNKGEKSYTFYIASVFIQCYIRYRRWIQHYRRLFSNKQKISWNSTCYRIFIFSTWKTLSELLSFCIPSNKQQSNILAKGAFTKIHHPDCIHTKENSLKAANRPNKNFLQTKPQSYPKAVLCFIDKKLNSEVTSNTNFIRYL